MRTEVNAHCNGLRNTKKLVHSFAFERQQLAIKVIAVYCAIGYIILISLLLGYWCRPIWEYWAVPVRYCELLSWILRHYLVFLARY